MFRSVSISLLDRLVAAITAKGYASGFRGGRHTHLHQAARCSTALTAPYCTLSATKRSSPSALDTSSRMDFLPSFFS